jgi:tetratricopeptide (TPR) repeat protein
MSAKTRDWRDLAIDEGVLAEPTSDGNRLILWLRGDRDQSFQHWERITSVVRADVKLEHGLCSTEANSIPARKDLRGGLTTLWRRVAPAKETRALHLPNGDSVEQCGERQGGLILVWAAAEGDPIDEARLKSQWPEGQRFQRLGPNLYMVSGVDSKAAKTAEQAPAPPPAASPAHSRPREQAERLLAAARQSGDRGKVASALTDLGVTVLNEGDPPKALALLEEALTLTRQLGDRARESDVLVNLGMAALGVNQLQRARQIFEQELDWARATHNHLVEKIILERLAMTAGKMGNFQAALELFEKALPLARLVGDRQQEANLLWYQGIQHAALGQRDLAEAKAEAAIAVLKLMGKPQAAWYGAQLQKYRMGMVEDAPVGPAPGPGPGAPASPHDYLGGAIAAHAMASQSNLDQARSLNKTISGPGLLAMAMSATKAMANFVGSGFKTVSPEIQRKRLDSCASCEHHTGMRCKICGCFTAVKSGMLHEDCPIGKWPA